MQFLATKPATVIPERSTRTHVGSTTRCLGYRKARVEEATSSAAYTNLSLQKLGYNTVLCNLYRNGYDSVGLHADAEPGDGACIRPVSLGAERLFRLKRKNGSVAFSERLPAVANHGWRHAATLQT